MVGRKPALSMAQVREAAASIARRESEPNLSGWARRYGVKPHTLRRAIMGRTKNLRIV